MGTNQNNFPDWRGDSHDLFGLFGWSKGVQNWLEMGSSPNFLALNFVCLALNGLSILFQSLICELPRVWTNYTSEGKKQCCGSGSGWIRVFWVPKFKPCRVHQISSWVSLYVKCYNFVFNILKAYLSSILLYAGYIWVLLRPEPRIRIR